jgi:predicted ATPase
MVGRARELDVLRGTWERATGESVPHLVTVLGPAGIGKTRLAQEFAVAVEEAGGRAVQGRSLPYRESSAYFAFSTQVKQLCGIFESDSPEVGRAKLRERIDAELPVGVDTEAVAGHLAILMGLDPDGSVDDREELFFSVRVFIEALARKQSMLLVFEDIHWADRGLLDLIELLAARLRDLPVLLLTLARPELLDLRTVMGRRPRRLHRAATRRIEPPRGRGARDSAVAQPRPGPGGAARGHCGREPALHRAARGDDGGVVVDRCAADDDPRPALGAP